MKSIGRQLCKNFILISVVSIAFITIIANISIFVFFSGYLKKSRESEDVKVIEYVEQAYQSENGMNMQSTMSLMHAMFREDISIRIRNIQGDIIWSDNGAGNMMRGMMGGNGYGKYNQSSNVNLSYKSYPLELNGSQIGTIDIGRPSSIISTIEDKQFLRTINVVFVIAFLFSVMLAILSSTRMSKIFLKPIYQMKENAKLIEQGQYKNLKEVETNTYELHDLAISVKELADRLDHQNILRQRLTSDVAHELRTPLATIQSHIEAFIDGVWEPNPEKLSIIYDEITRLTKLIKDLSDLSVLEGNQVKLNIREVDLSSLLQNVAENFEPVYEGKNISLYKDIQKDIVINGDADRLNQIFINLLSNANKYTNENGKVLISMKQVDQKITVTVQDNGIGIPESDIKHIFERFYRSDLSRNRGTGGTGIGLTITKAFVEAHGGKIRIESKVGEGTKVIIEFIKTP